MSTNRSLIRNATKVATILFVVTAILQLALAAGILPVSMAWGGQQTVLAPNLRYASLVAAALLLVFAYVIRRRAMLIEGKPVPTSIRLLSWLITGYMILNTLGNVASVSLGEKLLFGPISFLLVACCWVISSSRSEA
jgi:hypothetical protein